MYMRGPGRYRVGLGQTPVTIVQHGPLPTNPCPPGMIYQPQFGCINLHSNVMYPLQPAAPPGTVTAGPLPLGTSPVYQPIDMAPAPLPAPLPAAPLPEAPAAPLPGGFSFASIPAWAWGVIAIGAVLILNQRGGGKR